MDYFNDYKTMENINNVLESDKYVADGSIDNWYTHYQKWLNTTQVDEIVMTSQCLQSVAWLAWQFLQCVTWLL